MELEHSRAAEQREVMHSRAAEQREVRLSQDSVSCGPMARKQSSTAGLAVPLMLTWCAQEHGHPHVPVWADQAASVLLLLVSLSHVTGLTHLCIHPLRWRQSVV